MEKVVCFGASLTEGTVSYNYLSLLEARSSLARFQFLNHGVNGELVWNGLQRLDKAIAERPDAVVVVMGTNDVNATLSERNRLRYVTFNHLPISPTLLWYEENLTILVRRLKEETSARIALGSLAVIGEDLEHEANQRVALYNEAVRRVAEAEKAAYLPVFERMVDYLRQHEAARLGRPRLAYRDGLTNIGNAIALHASGMSWDEISERNGLLLTTDCIHLNSTGAGLIADLVEAWLLSRET